METKWDANSCIVSTSFPNQANIDGSLSSRNVQATNPSEHTHRHNPTVHFKIDKLRESMRESSQISNHFAYSVICKTPGFLQTDLSVACLLSRLCQVTHSRYSMDGRARESSPIDIRNGTSWIINIQIRSNARFTRKRTWERLLVIFLSNRCIRISPLDEYVRSS